MENVVKLGYIRFMLRVRKVANPVTNCFMFHFCLAVIRKYSNNNTYASSLQFVTFRKMSFFVCERISETAYIFYIPCSKFSRCLRSR
jgi:hypothetical protein